MPGTGPSDRGMANAPEAIVAPTAEARRRAGTSVILPSGRGLPSSVIVPETGSRLNSSPAAPQPEMAAARTATAPAWIMIFMASDSRLAQYWSAERPRPPTALKRACQTERLIVFLMKWTEPSQNDAFTPPGWALREPM